MTDQQIRLYAIARVALPADVRVRAIRDDAPAMVGGSIYTIETTDPKGAIRWFGIAAAALRHPYPDRVIGQEIQRAYDKSTRGE